MTRLNLIIGILLTSQCFGQTHRENSLLVAEYKKYEEGIDDYTYLVRYNFTDGQLISKDTVLSAPISKGENQGSYVRFDCGLNFVYKNRYVISGIGNVIDLQTKSLVMEASDELIETRGDSIIFRRNNIITGKGYLVCDLKTRSYGFVRDKRFLNVKGINSPNHLFGIEVDYSKLPYKILLYDKKNRQMEIVNDCGKGTLLSLISSSWPNVPVYWINNQDFLYAVYSLNRPLKNGISATVTINKFNIETKDSEIVAKIDSVPPAVSISSFSKDPVGTIIFDCEKGQYSIDISKKLAVPYLMSSVDNDFFIDNNMDEAYGRIIVYKSKEIGRIWCKYYNAKTTTGFIGVEYGDVGSNLGLPKGIRVWNCQTGIWTDIDVPRLSSIIGWIDK